MNEMYENVQSEAQETEHKDEHEEEHQRLNELVKKYLANDIEETDIEAEDRSVVKAMANASKKVEKMTKCRRETYVQRSQSEI